MSPRELLRTFDKLISQKLFTMEEYKNWEAGQKPTIDETDQEKPLTPKPTPSKDPEVNRVELEKPPEAGLKKCPTCGVLISTASAYCVACSDKQLGGESIKVVARKNGYAIAGLCLGIASVFLYQIGLIPLLAVVFSSIGLYKGGAREGKEAALAWIGLALGIAFTLSYLHYYGHI